MSIFKPELVAPAGNLEKLQIAYLYGADAVYLGTPVFGLRKYADNLNIDQLKIACSVATSYQKKLYLVLNGFAHNEDLDSVCKFLSQIQSFAIHGLVISDLGIFHLAKQLTSFPIHISTQANITNPQSGLFWKEQGAKRLILARELSLEECVDIKTQTGLEVEVFIHGARCAGYSGNCILSNYSSARDANRGGCVQNCRHFFTFFHESDGQKVGSGYVMNSKDLMSIDLLPKLISARIDALKIEGRMKSALYLANTVRIYRQILDNTTLSSEALKSELEKIFNRSFCAGYLGGGDPASFVLFHESFQSKTIQFIGVIKQVFSDGACLVEVRNPFCVGDCLEYLHPNGTLHAVHVQKIWSSQGEILSSARINQLVLLDSIPEPVLFGVIRK